MTNSIALVGLMGAGKSTIGKSLAERLGYVFIDTDTEIVNRIGMSINEYFETHSEQEFRTLETEVIKEFAKSNNTVISLGGGAFESETNRTLLLDKTTVIYLYADVDTLYERVKTDDSRPLLKCDDPRGKLKELLEKREPNYLKAHFKVDTDKNIDEIIEKILLLG